MALSRLSRAQPTVSGIDVAVVPTGSSTREALQAAKPDHYLEKFSDLVKVVAG